MNSVERNVTKRTRLNRVEQILIEAVKAAYLPALKYPSIDDGLLFIEEKITGKSYGAFSKFIYSTNSETTSVTRFEAILLLDRIPYAASCWICNDIVLNFELVTMENVKYADRYDISVMLEKAEIFVEGSVEAFVESGMSSTLH